MFLDDTACNLASLNLLTFYDAEDRQFDVEAYQHAIRIWTIVLEISVLMASSRAQRSPGSRYKFRTLGLGYANLGALLMVQGIPYDSPEGRAQCGALTAIITPAALRHQRRDGRRARAVPRLRGEQATPCCGSIRNHRRAAYNAAPREYEGLTVYARRHRRRAYCPPDLLAAARRESRPHARTRREARLPQRPGRPSSPRPARSAC